MVKKYLQALHQLSQHCEEAEVQDLLVQALTLLNGPTDLPFEDIVKINENQITSQLSKVKSEHQSYLLASLQAEKQTILSRILAKTSNLTHSVALLRAVEQILENK